jgi:hypothetical protein
MSSTHEETQLLKALRQLWQLQPWRWNDDERERDQ